MATIRPDENCPCCGLPDEADREMVQCDRCDVWYHFRCVGVTEAVRNVEWICRPCEIEEFRQKVSSRMLHPEDCEEEDCYSVPPSELSSLPSHTSQSIRQGLQLLDEQFQLRQKRLADEKALQERRLALEAEFVKQQNDLQEEHLKERQELLSSMREMSIGGSWASARSQVSMRSERVRQWMDRQQNPVENPTSVDLRGAAPKTRRTTRVQNLSPLRNPDVPQKREGSINGDGVRFGKLNDSLSTGTRFDACNDEIFHDESWRRNVPVAPTRPCPAPRKFVDWHRNMTSTAELDYRQHGASRHFADGLGQRSTLTATGQGANRPYIGQADFADNHREVFGKHPANVQISPINRTIPEASRRCAGQESEAVAERDQRLFPKRDDETRGRYYDPDSNKFPLEPLTGAAGSRPTDGLMMQSRPQTPRYIGRDERQQNQVENSVRQGSVPYGGITPDQLAARNVLPRKLPIFSGNYEEWPLFISCYNTTTEACGYTNNENLVGLLDCLREPALGHVRGRLLLPQSVPKVIETLQRIYGRPEQLLQSLLTKARRCNPPKPDRLESFITFSLVIEQLCDHLEATDLRDHLVNPLLLQELVDKIPPSTKLDWVRFKRGREQVTLRTFADFMSGLAADASKVAPIIEPKQNAGEKPGEKRAKDKGFVHAHDGGTVTQQTTNERTDKPCRACQSTEHKIIRPSEPPVLLHLPKAAAAITQRHYVDDYFDSADTEDEAIERAKAVKYIHSEGGFHIRNWVSNSARFLEALGEPDLKQTVQFTSDKHTNTERILGISWNPVLDVFTFSVPANETLQPFLNGKARPTKSIVLKFLMSFFDPLGLVAHYLVHGKILMQDIWRSGCDWKEAINDECYDSWIQWIKWLPLLEQLQIPRSYFGGIRSSEIESVELHVFSDASEKAYGSGAYLRVVCDGVVRCTLALAKTKVAPLKLLSIPRLEVSGAVLGARLANTAETCHTLPISRRVLWLDSATVMAWIRSDHRKYKPFVAHRISEILSLTNVDEWRFVSTKSNVADDLTKWKKRFTMSCDDRSIRGPDFIYRDSKSWSVPETPIEDVEEELRAVFLFHEIHLPEPVINAGRFSSWKTLVRSLAVIFRFRANCKRKARGLPVETVPATTKVTKHVMTGIVLSEEVPLRHEECVQAENCFWRLVQAEAYPDEVKVLLKNRELPREKWYQIETSSLIYKLSPFLDDVSVLRMEGRTEAADGLPFDLRFPVILPKSHPITIMLIEHYHRKFRHGNNETVVNEMRQRFVIGNLRVAVRKVASECQLCKIRKSRPAVPRMAPLPTQRLLPNLRPFSFVGLDYCGPFMVTVGRRSEKRWVAVFTCFNTRAIHLEVAHSLNKQSCLMALRRFMCKYGTPREIFSDNGTNFHGANNEGVLIRAINNNCADVVTDARLKWNFNPPSAPHMGGVWERMVRSVKACLNVLDDGRKLTDEVLLTVLAEAGDIINSRTLTYQPQDTSTPEALTPNQFLRVGPANEELVLNSADEGEALRDGYQRSQLLAQRMWKRWLSEYVPTLNRRLKWYEEREPVKPGDVVFIADEEQRKTWIRGIVEEVITAKDGRVRQAVVRAQGKLYKRPVAKLAVIEVGARKERSEPESEAARD